ncbi:MAG: hypothetical protein HOV94_12375 [Saccharothrix sp.]|nr:hypothetical protein [Saccharothrix sp.]
MKRFNAGTRPATLSIEQAGSMFGQPHPCRGAGHVSSLAALFKRFDIHFNEEEEGCARHGD